MTKSQSLFILRENWHHVWPDADKDTREVGKIDCGAFWRGLITTELSKRSVSGSFSGKNLQWMRLMLVRVRWLYRAVSNPLLPGPFSISTTFVRVISSSFLSMKSLQVLTHSNFKGQSILSRIARRHEGISSSYGALRMVGGKLRRFLFESGKTRSPNAPNLWRIRWRC